jgi:hypothetical protein
MDYPKRDSLSKRTGRRNRKQTPILVQTKRQRKTKASQRTTTTTINLNQRMERRRMENDQELHQCLRMMS